MGRRNREKKREERQIEREFVGREEVRRDDSEGVRKEKKQREETK